MLVSKITENDLTTETIDKLLFQGLEDTGENADCIIVLGSMKASKYRLPVAVQAYAEGRASKIMLCGGKMREFSDGNSTEAKHMQQAALALGITEEALIIEDQSQNTVENIRFALHELQRTFGLYNVHRILLVTTTYHMRRSLTIARYLLPAHIDIIPYPANDTNTKRENWMNTPVGIERVKNEARKIVKYVNDGVIPDFEI